MDQDIKKPEDEESREPEPSGKSKVFFQVFKIILMIVSSVLIIADGVQDHNPVVSTVWFAIILATAIYFMENERLIAYCIKKSDFNDSSVWGRIILIVIFAVLLLVSYLLYLGIKCLGLDLLAWTF